MHPQPPPQRHPYLVLINSLARLLIRYLRCFTSPRFSLSLPFIYAVQVVTSLLLPISPTVIHFTTNANHTMKFWALLALAASVTAIPFEGGILHKRAGERIHIGYRIVSKVRLLHPTQPNQLTPPPFPPSQEEADAINDNGGKAVQSRGTMGRQLGTGTYISPAFHDFPDYDPSKGLPWDCAVTVDAAAWSGLKKAWVPKMFEFPEDKEKNPDKCKPLPLWLGCWVHARNTPYRPATAKLSPPPVYYL